MAQGSGRADRVQLGDPDRAGAQSGGGRIGSEAHGLLVRYLFAHTQVNRIEAATEITNVAEQRALEQAGFTREGVLRGPTFRQGRWHDQVLYSVLRDEVKLDEAAAAADATVRPTRRRRAGGRGCRCRSGTSA